MTSRVCADMIVRADGQAKAKDKARYGLDHPLHMTAAEWSSCVEGDTHREMLRATGKANGFDAILLGWPVVFVEGTT